MTIGKIISLAWSDGGSSSSPSSSSSRQHPPSDRGAERGTPATLLACSALRPPQNADVSFPGGRKLCEDRRPVFDHLKPNKFFRNVIRITFIQSSNVFTSYYTDLLKLDMEREEKVAAGELTREQAEQESEEWQEVEWSRRLEGIGQRIGIAFVKYHAVVLVMRLYEYIASFHVDEVVLDALTMDTYESAKREAKSKEGRDLGLKMMNTCWSANLISFLADYSVHQVILAYGYYVYVQQQRKKIKQSSAIVTTETTEEMHVGSLALSFLRKSTHLAATRFVALGLSSVGGGLGSIVWPGWGTLVGTNMGDSLALQLTEDAPEPVSTETEAPPLDDC